MHVAKTGLVSAVGLSSAAACAAIRAGLSMLEELPYHDNGGEPIVGTQVPFTPPGEEPQQPASFADRVADLVLMAVEDCLDADDWAALPATPLFLGLPEVDRPGVPEGLAAQVLARLAQACGLDAAPAGWESIERGNVSAMVALDSARRAIEAGSETCVVVAADSFVRARSLLWLEQHGRLKRSDNSDGTIPGEGAAALLLTARPPETGAVRVAGLGFAEESAHYFTEEPLLGLGLAAAIRGGLDQVGIGMHQVTHRLADVNGESYGFKELALAAARLIREPIDSMPLWHPAESIGDVGAAAGAVSIALAHDAFAKGYAPGDTALCTASSIGGARAAAVLTGPESTEGANER